MNLTQTAILTRRFILIFIISVTLGLISFTGYRIWYANYLANLPPVEEKPDNKFGSLPEPDFPKSQVSSSNYSYSLDTTTGGLPAFEKVVRVYFIPKASATFLAPQKSEALAKKFNLNPPAQVLSETKYRYFGNDSEITIDIDTGNFVYSKQATAAAKLVGQELLKEDNNRLAQDFKNFLDRNQIITQSLNNGPSKLQFFKFVNDQLIATDGNEAQALQISFWPEELDKKPILTGDFNKALVNALVIKSAKDLENYVALNFTFWPIDTSTFATYSVKSTDQALNELKSGKGVIIIEPPKPQVSITSVYLGYYQPANYSPYLLPIFVFEGPAFAAYIPAIQ